MGYEKTNSIFVSTSTIYQAAFVFEHSHLTRMNSDELWLGTVWCMVLIENANVLYPDDFLSQVDYDFSTRKRVSLQYNTYVHILVLVDVQDDSALRRLKRKIMRQNT